MGQRSLIGRSDVVVLAEVRLQYVGEINTESKSIQIVSRALLLLSNRTLQKTPSTSQANDQCWLSLNDLDDGCYQAIDYVAPRQQQTSITFFHAAEWSLNRGILIRYDSHSDSYTPPLSDRLVYSTLLAWPDPRPSIPSRLCDRLPS